MQDVTHASYQEEPFDASVVIATRNREPRLRRTLEALAAQQFQGRWELVAVDNGSTDQTSATLETMRSQLPLVCLRESIAGKSRALNRALDIVRGKLIIFTDDDILVLPTWISELIRASHSYPDACVFCGPVIPLFPDDTPIWLRNHPFSAIAFAKFMPSVPEGPLPAQWVPSGGNFAVRATAMNGHRFRLDLGPSIYGNLMGEDTDFVERLCRQPEQLIFIPGAAVQHCIRPELTVLPVLQERAFNSGRSLMIMGKEPTFVALKSSEDSSRSEVRAFEMGIVLSFYFGQLYQADLDGKHQHCQLLMNGIEQLGWPRDVERIALSAAEWLRTAPACLALRKTDAC